jgi:YHS domain-containing protein
MLKQVYKGLAYYYATLRFLQEFSESSKAVLRRGGSRTREANLKLKNT